MINKEDWAKKCEEIYPDTNIEISETHNFIEIEVVSDCNEINVNMGKLMRIAEIFGTLDFDMKNEHTVTHWAYSEYTQGDDHIYSQTFLVKKKNLNSGLPWEKAKNAPL